MANLTLIPASERGRPRLNKGDKTGTVRVTLTMPNADGNMTRTFSIANAKVSDVFTALTKGLKASKAPKASPVTA